MTTRPGQARGPRWVAKAPPPPAMADRAPVPPPIAFRAGLTAWGLFYSQQRPR